MARLIRPPSGIVPAGGGAHCHHLIAETAQKMAHELYDICMHDNSIWTKWKNACPELTRELLEEKFVELLWPKLIEQARATLARMLAMPYPESLKSSIHDALIKDASLRRGRNRGAGFRVHRGTTALH